MLYHIALLLHLLGVGFALFAAGMLWFVRGRLPEAQTVDQAGALLAAGGSTALLMPVFSLVIFVSGMLLTRAGWSYADGWVIAGIAGLFVMSVIGGGVLKPRAMRLKALLSEAAPGAPSPELRNELRDPVWAAAEMTNMSITVAVMCDMVLKPSFAASFAVLLVLPVAGIALQTLLQRRVARRFAGAIAVIALALAGASQTGARASTSDGIAFDQVQFYVAAGQPRPAASGFEADYEKALQTAQRRAAQSDGSPDEARRNARKIAGIYGAAVSGQAALGMLQAAIPGLGSMAAGAAGDAFHNAILGQIRANGADARSVLSTGTLTRYAFNARGWERIEIPQYHTVMIVKPELHQAIVLDTLHKTWTQRSVSDAEMERGGAALGTMVASYAPEASAVGPRTFDGHSASGSRVAATIVGTSATGTCKNGTTRLVNTVYFANDLTAPRILQVQDAAAQLSTGPGCVAQVEPGVPAVAKLALYLITDVNGGTADASGDDALAKLLAADREAAYGDNGFAKASGTSPETIVTERGHVRTLTPVDAALFEVPADYSGVSAGSP